ncbi:MAG: antibiotic biosynthesis monooxygenase [Bacteroidia bacterium]
MTAFTLEPLAEHLTQHNLNGEEISITGKWVPLKKGGIFRKSADSKEMLKEWEDIHAEARNHPGMLSTEINHTVGQDAVLVHHVFKNADALVSYFASTATQHAKALMAVAKPDIHVVRGSNITPVAIDAIKEKGIPVAFGNYLFGYVKNEYERPNPETSVQVTAKWTCKNEEDLNELIYWWQKVGTDAYTIEKGLVRFEAYQVIGESALIIHETFDSSDELKYHLTKGTAEIYKKQLDKIAAPENYFFRGPVSWTIRTYSKFMGLPATYSSQGSNYMVQGGNFSEGIINTNQNTNMKNANITVVYQWTAKEGKSEELKAIYKEVSDQMQKNEPGALDVQVYFDEKRDTLVVSDLFADANALGFHLGTTAAGHFPSLLEIANPGPFLFCGDVPEEMKQAAIKMGLDATFAPQQFGFARA